MEHRCAWYTHVTGQDPQTGKQMDHWDCAVRWLPVLITEQARQTRNVGASVDSMRNEVVQRQDVLNSAIRVAQSTPPPRIENEPGSDNAY